MTLKQMFVVREAQVPFAQSAVNLTGCCDASSEHPLASLGRFSIGASEDRQDGDPSFRWCAPATVKLLPVNLRPAPAHAFMGFHHTARPPSGQS
jgi:hypothetical protein